MNRIDTKFAELKKSGKTALIPFITAGDPNLSATIDLVLAMEKSGADIIELGIPFSDPMAEGHVIQEANVRALNAGTDTNRIFEAVSQIRKKSQVPLVYLLYYNTIVAYGAESFFENCAKCGVDGLIIPDLPYEEHEEIAEYANKYNIYQIQLIAPTSTKERIEKICRIAKGFIYCVSSLGVTGMRSSFTTNFDNIRKTVNGVTNTPMCIGFGISRPEHITQLKPYADGLIVGSALVKRIGECKENSEALENAVKFIKELKCGFDE